VDLVYGRFRDETLNSETATEDLSTAETLSPGWL